MTPLPLPSGPRIIRENLRHLQLASTIAKPENHLTAMKGPKNLKKKAVSYS